MVSHCFILLLWFAYLFSNLSMHFHFSQQDEDKSSIQKGSIDITAPNGNINPGFEADAGEKGQGGQFRYFTEKESTGL